MKKPRKVSRPPRMVSDLRGVAGGVENPTNTPMKLKDHVDNPSNTPLK